MGNSAYRTIKIQIASYEKLQALVAELSQKGWGSIGVQRQEPPMLCTVVDEAISALLARASKKGKARD